MDDVIFSEDSQIFKIQYLRNYAIKMHRVNAKKFQKFFPNDMFYKINNDSDFIAPLKESIIESRFNPKKSKDKAIFDTHSKK